jgi:SAM-dependent methyltransferase
MAAEGWVHASGGAGMSTPRDEIARRVASFSRWHYEFDLHGVRTPIANPKDVSRTRERRRYFFDALLQVCGGDLRGKRVLDLGCNAGYWSLAAIDAGCDFVLGVEGRQEAIDQARLVFEDAAVDPRRFELVRSNVFDYDLVAAGPFDVVLCLGLLYHVSKPVELLETISRCNTDLLVIDSLLSLARGERLDLHRERLDDPRNSVDYEIVLFPTRRCVLSMARQFGYDARVLRPRVLRPTVIERDNMEDYLDGRRRAFLCAKHSDLAGLPVDHEESPPLAKVRARGKEALRALSARAAHRPSPAGS